MTGSEIDPLNAYTGYETWKGWGELFAFSPDDARAFAGETRGLLVAASEVLEIGFGSGAFLAWAQSRGARVTGIEIIPQLAEAARSRGIELLSPAFEDVAEENRERFDTIVAYDVFEHFSQNQIIVRLRAAAIMLKFGGKLLVRFPNAQSPFGLAPQNWHFCLRKGFKIAYCKRVLTVFGFRLW